MEVHENHDIWWSRILVSNESHHLSDNRLKELLGESITRIEWIMYFFFLNHVDGLGAQFYSSCSNTSLVYIRRIFYTQ